SDHSAGTGSGPHTTRREGELETSLAFPDNRLLIDLCGELDSNLARIERTTGVQIARRGNALSLHGEAAARAEAAQALTSLYERLEQGRAVEAGDVEAALRMPHPSRSGAATSKIEMFGRDGMALRTRKKTIEPRTPAQAEYLRAMFENELVFAFGPAGTGKTYLAVAVAVSMFLDGQVDRIVLSRP